MSATCRSGLVRVSGSPALGWQIEDIDGGARPEARVRFEPGDDDGRVEVEAVCVQGAPRFTLDDDSSGDDSNDDDSYDDDSNDDGGDD